MIVPVQVIFSSIFAFQSAEHGVCFTIASRLRHVEAIRDWPVSIRIAVSVEMSSDNLDHAVEVLEKAVDFARAETSNL